MITFESQGRACSHGRLLVLSRSFARHGCRRFSLLLFLSLSLFLSACSLAGDVTPPPGTNTTISSGPAATGLPATANAAAAQPTSATSAFYPAAMPAAQEGGLLYAQHCAPCHGDKGAGNGTAATQLPTRPPDFSDPATLRGQTPQLIFSTITQGNQQALMPPFASTLTDAQRWSLVSFLYTLSTPPERLAAGKTVYTANCARCHGADGAGKGPDAAAQPQPLPSFADQAFMAAHSQQDFFKVVSGGDQAHSFTNLGEADRWAALDAVRAFSYVYIDPNQLTAERPGSVTGKVTNGTAGGAVPAGLAITLHSFDGQTLLGTFTTTAAADGGFHLDAVPFTPSRQFLATAVYHGVTYASQVGTFDAAAGTMNLVLPIYETTTDAGALIVDQVHMFLEFNSPDTVTVGQLFIFSNNGDKAYASSQDHPLAFSLPPGAANINVQDAQQGQTFFPTAGGFSLVWSVPPGQGATQILFSFQLPYPNELTYRQTMDYPVSNVDVLVSDLGVQLSGPQLRSLGLQNFQGQAFQNFSSGAIARGQALDLTVSGKAGTGATAPTGVLNSSTGTLAIGLGALALALAGIGLWLYRRPRAQVEAARNKEDLLEALAELDDAYAAGGVPEAEYQKERGKMKQELTKLWES
jgi:mono/diheme cytochrome c family protein